MAKQLDDGVSEIIEIVSVKLRCRLRAESVIGMHHPNPIVIIVFKKRVLEIDPVKRAKVVGSIP
jgi:hypothetical protein